MRLITVGVVLGAASLVACSTLPDVPTDQCGNGVVEADHGEDCDRDAADCGAPGTAAECRLLCGEAGGGATCPAGAACGQDGVCRAPGQAFVVSADTRWTSPALLVGDTTADGLPELIGLSDQAIDVRLGAVDASYAEQVEVPNLPMFGVPRISDLDADGTSDLTIPVGIGIYSIAGDPYSVVRPIFQNSFPVPGTGPLPLSSVNYVTLGPTGLIPTSQTLVALHVPQGSSCLLPAGCDVLTLGDGGVGFPAGKSLDQLGTAQVPYTFTTTYPTIVTVLSFEDDPNTPLVDEGGVYLYRGDPAAQTLTLVGQLTVTGRVRKGAWFADVTGDGIDDLLVAVDTLGNASISMSRGHGDGTFDAAITIVGGPGVTRPGGDAIAWADVDGDRKADLIGAQEILLNRGASPSPSTWVATSIEGKTWTEAIAVDLNGDGRLDVVAHDAADSSLDVLYGTQWPGLWNAAPISAPGDVRAMRSGDYDGDGVKDLALVTRRDDGDDDLYVVFGGAGPLPSPTYMGFIGQALDLDTTVALVPGQYDAIDDLMVAADRNGVRGAALVLGSTSRRMIAPLIPSGETNKLNLVETVLSVPLDNDATADVATLVTELDATGADTGVQRAFVRIFRSATDGSLTEMTTPPGVEMDPAMFHLRDAQWVAIPRHGNQPVMLIGGDLLGKVIVMTVTCNATCTGGAPQNLSLSPARTPLAFHTADLDGDGDLDVYAAMRPIADASAGEVAVWINNNGLSSAQTIAAPPGTAISDVAAIDLDLDGVAELVLLTRTAAGASGASSLGGTYVSKVIAGQYQPAQPFDAVAQAGVDARGGLTLHAGDLDGDGLPDLALVSGADRGTPRNLVVLRQREARIPAASGGK